MNHSLRLLSFLLLTAITVCLPLSGTSRNVPARPGRAESPLPNILWKLRSQRKIEMAFQYGRRLFVGDRWQLKADAKHGQKNRTKS
jgi:hypothetical protein